MLIWKNISETSQANMKIIKGFKIDPVIFTYKFVKACDICLCSGECCYYGVYTEVSEMKKILEIKDRIVDAMDDSQLKDPEQWFEEPVEDDDFESGLAVGTEVYNGKCVFLDKHGFCTLQKITYQSGENKWKYKPLYCILFPLVISDGVLTVDDDHMGRMHYCSVTANQTSTVFETCANELKFVLGEDGFEELSEYRNQYLAGLNKSTNEGS